MALESCGHKLFIKPGRMEKTIIKPDAILQLEREYNIQLTDFNASEGFGRRKDGITFNAGTYELNRAQKLIGLNLSSCGIEYISTIISDLTDLRYLNLNDNKIKDISLLSSLVNLRTLFICENSIDNIDAIAGLLNLKILAIWENPLKDIEAIKELVNLETLACQNTGIDDISVLGWAN